MKTHYDLVVIGDGPAGMAAAISAGENKLSVLIIGEQPRPGGQIYRNTEGIGSDIANILGSEYAKGKKLIKAFHQARIDYLPGATVWHVQAESDFVISYSSERDTRQIRSNRIIFATGARERPIPIPGWTLPGVMATTAAEILLKSSRIIPTGDTVLAGSGPLFLLVAVHLISAGASIRAILDTTPYSNYFKSLKHLPKALLAYKNLYKGIQMQLKIHKSGVPIYRNVKNLEAVGRDSVERIHFQSAGRTHEVEANILLLHHGLVPDTQMTFLLDCDHKWYDVQRYWRPVVDRWGNTSVNGIGVAGDATGIAGANAAEISGYLAGLGAAFSLEKISKEERDQKAIPFQKKLTRETYVRPFLDDLYRPSQDLLIPRDEETTVCRCEEVTAGQVRKALESSLSNPNQVKAQTRCGMGPCQGRLCGLTLSEMIADYGKLNISDLEHFRIRPPVKPLTMEQLANIQLIDRLEDVNEIS